MDDLRPAPGCGNLRSLVLEHVKRHYARLGRSPSLREIAAALRISRDRAREALAALEREGEVILAHAVSGARLRITLADRLDELSEGDVLLILRRRGWLLDLGTVDSPPGMTAGVVTPSTEADQPSASV